MPVRDIFLCQVLVLVEWLLISVMNSQAFPTFCIFLFFAAQSKHIKVQNFFMGPVSDGARHSC